MNVEYHLLTFKDVVCAPYSLSGKCLNTLSAAA